ncbi:MAG: cell envelope integrity protein TolA [Gammaproteobacteria bacterium]
MPVSRLRSTRSLVYAVAVHVAALLLLIFSVDFSNNPAPQPADGKVIEARAVDQTKVDTELQRLRDADKKKQAEEDNKRKALERDIAAAKAKRLAEEQRLAEAKQQKAEVEKQKRVEERKLKAAEAERKKEEAQKLKLAEERKRLEAEQAQRLAERQRREEQEKRLAAEEDKKKALADRHQRDEEARRKRELEQALAAEEQARTEAARSARDQAELERYLRTIAGEIEDAFHTPERGRSCELLVRMVPGGDVIDAKVIRSSGSEAFDRQAEIAVRKAAPLSVPADPRLFEKMREIRFVFEPRA